MLLTDFLCKYSKQWKDIAKIG